MKKWIGIVVGLIVVLGLAWLAFRWQRPRPEVKTSQPISVDDPQIMIDTKIIKSVEIGNDKGKIKFGKDENGKWRIVEPVNDMAEMILLGAFLDELYKIYPQKVIPKQGQEPLAQYGLEPPAATLKFGYVDGRIKVLRIGELNPTGDLLYSLFETEPDILLISTRIRMFIDKDVNFYRFRSILDVKAEGVQEFKIVVLDPKLRKDLDVPERRHLMLQKTDQGKMWMMLEPFKEESDSSGVGQILYWMEKSSVANDIMDVSRQQLPAWQLDPPRAYLEIIYPDRTEKILIGKEEGDKVYLFQDKKMVVLGYKKSQVYALLGGDYRVKKLLSPKEFREFDRIEVRFPAGKNPGYNLVKSNDKLWAVDGDPQKKFARPRINWVTKDFLQTDLIGYYNQRPIDLAAYDLQSPALEIKFYQNNKLLRDFLVSRWNKAQKITFVYDPTRDILVGYAKDIAEWIPPDAEKFLIKVKKEEKKENQKE